MITVLNSDDLSLGCGGGGVTCVGQEYGLEVTDAEGCFNRINAAVCALLGNVADTIRLGGVSGELVDDTSLAQILDAMSGNSSVTTLDLSMNRISDVGVVRLAEHLRTNHNNVVTALHLDGNAFTCVGASALCAALPQAPCQMLSLLDLSCCALGDEGAAVVAAMVRGGAPPVTTLHLRACGIMDAGCKELCAAVTASTLHTLHISANLITDAACEAIKEMAVSAPSLTDLSVASMSPLF